MKTVKHTPGPWKCYPVNSMTSNNNRTFEIHGFESAKYVRDVLPTETETNAKLIAASPTMYNYILSKANDGDDEAKEIINSLT